jgi:glycosyltransferase involved in cell wall biosynthesis
MVNLLKQANVYVTASRYEPCGNHYIEGVACGLPLLYHSDGGGVTSMRDFGLAYKDFDDFKVQLENISFNHQQYYDIIKDKFNFYHNVIFEKYCTVLEGAVKK